jgi:hypothetical protein
MTQNLSGLWKANLEKSNIIGPAPKSITAKIDHSDPDLSVAMTITMPDGAEHNLVFKGPTTGAEVFNVVNGREWQSQMHWIGTELLIESWVDFGSRKCHFRDFWSVSDDGHSLTMEHRNDDLEGQITVLENVSPEG